MKQKDIITIIVCVFIGGAISLVFSNIFIPTSKNRNTKVEVVERINADFNQPDARYFNINSFNPTQVIEISDNTKQPVNKQ